MKVLTNPNPKLRIRSTEIPEELIGSHEMKQLIENLKVTMKQERGVGIAAPQVGVQQRVIILDLGDGPQAFMNPVIIRYSHQKIDSEEGCLSVPGVFGIVRRHRGITVEAYNEQGEKVTIQNDQFPAIVFQHEIDHLNGILFIDKVVRFISRPTL